MKNKKIVYLLVAVVIVALISVLLFSQKTEKEEEVIKIGWIGPLTDNSAILGMDNVIASQIAVDEINNRGGINGKKIKLVVEDDQYTVSKTISAYEKLVNANGVNIILMQTYGAVFALADRSKQDEVILINVLDSNSKIADLGKNVFSIGIESESIAKLLSNYAEKEKYKKVGVLYFNSDTFMPYVKDVFVQEFNGVVIAEAHSVGTADFKTTLTKMKKENVEALVFLGYDEIGIAMKQARELSINFQFLASGTITSPSLQEASQGAVNGTIFTFWRASNKETEPAKTFLDEFKKRVGREPVVDLFTYPGYDSILALEKVLKISDVKDSQSVIQGLLGVKDLKGSMGQITFQSDGSVRIPFQTYKMIDGIPTPLND